MRRFGGVAALALAACGAPLRGVSDLAATVGGTVLEDGRPAAGVFLTVLGPSGSHKATTDGSGTWRVADVPPGEYWYYYQNPEEDERVTYWKSPTRGVAAGSSLRFSGIDVGHRGTPKEPGDGARINIPATFAWTDYPGASGYAFQVVDKIGNGSKVLFRPTHRFDAETTRIVYDGGINVQNFPGLRLKDFLGVEADFLPPGTYAWQAIIRTPDAGEGHGSARAFTIVETKPDIYPKPMDPPAD